VSYPLVAPPEPDWEYPDDNEMLPGRGLEDVGFTQPVGDI
jgi:hypothetical protein